MHLLRAFTQMPRTYAREVSYQKNISGPNATKSLKDIEWLGMMKSTGDPDPDNVKHPESPGNVWPDVTSPRINHPRAGMEMPGEISGTFGDRVRYAETDTIPFSSGSSQLQHHKSRRNVLSAPLPRDLSVDLITRRAHAKLVELYLAPSLGNTVWSVALQEIEDIVRVARESDYEIPSEKAIANAAHLLRAIPNDIHLIQSRIDIPEPMIYPTQDGEVAIHMSIEFGQSVIVLCDSKGGMLCLAGIEGNRRRAYYRSAQRHVDGFLRDALSDLGGGKLDLVAENYIG